MDKKKQLELSERLQVLLLENFEQLAVSGELTPTDRATLARLLTQNGWSIDPAAMPQGLASKLTSLVKFDDELPTDVK